MRKLQTRLVLSFILVIVVILCGVSAIFTLLIIRYPQQERLTFLELNTQARSILAVLRRLPNFNPDRLANYTVLDELAQRQEMRIAWATMDNQINFDSAHVWDADGFDLFALLTPGAGQRWSGRVREAGRIWLVVAHPTLESVDAQDSQQYLILAKPFNRPILSTIKQIRETIATPLLQAGAIALAMGILLAYAISRSIAKPLNTVSRAAQALADGDYGTRVTIKGPEEIEDLALIFNEMAGQVEASHQAQNDLVANVAHDLRTPLTSIQGYAQALMDGTADGSANRAQAARTIYEESRRMQNMINALLDLAKFQTGEIKLNRTAVDITHLVRDRIAFYQNQAQDAGLALIMTSTAESILCPADKERLVQVIDNLLSNALAHTPSGGRVTLDVTSSDLWVELSATDTGTGIPRDEIPRIFERFYRGDKSRRGSGTGLGLSIVKEIVTAHHGTISVESIVGVGSKFTVRLPANKIIHDN